MKLLEMAKFGVSQVKLQRFRGVFHMIGEVLISSFALWCGQDFSNVSYY